MSLFSIGVNFAFIDDKGDTSTTKVKIPTGLTIPGIVAFAQSAAQLFADFSTCRVTKVTACIGIDLSGLGLLASPTAQSDVSEKGLFNMRTASNTYARMFVPTISESLVVANSDALDPADADVIAFTTALEDGILTTGGTIVPVDTRGNEITEVTEAREFHRGFRPRS